MLLPVMQVTGRSNYIPTSRFATERLSQLSSMGSLETAHQHGISSLPPPHMSEVPPPHKLSDISYQPRHHAEKPQACSSSSHQITTHPDTHHHLFDQQHLHTTLPRHAVTYSQPQPSPSISIFPPSSTPKHKSGGLTPTVQHEASGTMHNHLYFPPHARPLFPGGEPTDTVVTATSN